MTAHESDRRAARIEQAIRLKRAAGRSRATDLPRRPEDRPARLGEMQRSLWLAHQMDPGSPAYNLTSCFRVRGPLDVERLETAFNEVVSAQRILRSTFRAAGDDVLQVVRPHLPLAIHRLGVGPGEALGTAVDVARQPFDLEAGSLIRLHLIEETPGDERLLLLVLHHILADERSLGHLWRGIAENYDGQPDGAGSRAQYDDFVFWQTERDSTGRQADLEYWSRWLDPLPEELRLPFEKSAATAGPARGRLLTRSLDPATGEGIRRLAADRGVSPFAVFAFAYRLLLDRYTDGRRVAFATPVSTRSHPDTATMIGYFLNPLVVTAPVDEGRSVEEAVREFGQGLREDMAHSSVSFQSLTEALEPPRRLDRHPVFQTMFVYQETAPPPTLGDARLEAVTLDLGASKFDLTVFVTEGGGSLEVAAEYRADRFERLWIERLLGHYGTLLESLPATARGTVADLSMLGEVERDRLRRYSRGPDLEAPTRPLLPQQILDRIASHPDSPAVICDGIRLTYGELGAGARSVADALGRCGVVSGDRVAVFLDRSSAMIVGLLGAHWAGAAYVPMDPAYPEARNRDLLEDAGVRAVVTTSDLSDRLPPGAWETVLLDRLEPTSETGLREAIAAQSPAYVLYTSGSTGRPKGVVVTHDNLRASTTARQQLYDPPPTRFLLLPSIAFDSSVAGLFWTLAEGGTLVIPTDGEVRDPDRLAQLTADEEVSALLCVPSLYSQLLTLGGDRLETLDTAIVAGESCPPRLVDQHFRMLPEVRLYNEYGPTEATVWCTMHELTRGDVNGPIPIGRPIPGVRVDVLDSRRRPLPTGIPGVAWVAGPTVTDGYWRRPELTAERFAATETAERGYNTGDRVVWTDRGELLFLGREDGQIKLRGFRIEAGEVEAALLHCPEVEQAAVVARSSATGSNSATDSATDSAGTYLAAFVETSGAAEVSDWRRIVAERLPQHMIPSRLVVLPGLPRLPNGKIDRGRLRDWELEAEVPEVPSPEVPSLTEQALQSLWEGLLGRSGIGLADNFFELGGHSLLVVEMTRAIEGDSGVALSAADVFENPTVRQLARRIEGQGGPATPSYQHLFPIQPTGREIPFIIAVPHFFSAMLAARFRGERPVYGLRGVSLRPEGNRGRWRTMNDLGEELVDEIQRRFGDQRCILAGYSFGATMAVEAARVMEERGLSVHRLLLIAPMAEDFYRFGPVRVQLDGLRQPADALSKTDALRLYARSNQPLTRRPYQRAWRWLAIEPWRRFLSRVGIARSRAGQPLSPRILHADLRVERFRLHAGYRPGIVHAPTVVFNPEQTATDAAATWRPYFDGPFTVVPTPDPHEEGSVEAAQQVILRHLAELVEG